MQEIPKSPEIIIIKIVCAAFIEQENITLHNHKDSIDCYNKNNGVGRYTFKPESMLSNIQKNRLRKIKTAKLWLKSTWREGRKSF